jgi:hypothetical protein
VRRHAPSAIVVTDAQGPGRNIASTTAIGIRPKWRTPPDGLFRPAGQQFGPDPGFHFHFDDPGICQLRGQFRLASGQVLTVTFTVQAV